MSQFPPPSNPPVQQQQQQQQSSAADGSRTLYVGNLDTKVTEYMLLDIFATCGHVLSVKIIQDKNVNNIKRKQ
jgi:nucleolysin TIA-1/TIAR